MYLPPSRKNDLTTIYHHLDSVGAIVSHLEAHDHSLLFGDYNQPGLAWNFSAMNDLSVDVAQSRISTASAALLDGFSLHNLSQINTVVNQNGRTLDLALVDDSLKDNCTLTESVVPLLTLDPDHPAFEIEVNVPSPIEYDQLSNEPDLDFRKTDFEGLSEALLRTDWTFLENSTNIDAAVDQFSRLTNNILLDHVPHRRPTAKPPWGNSRLRHLKRIRSRTLRIYCRSRCLFTKQQFTRASNNYRLYNRFLYKRYAIRTQDNLRRNPKQFWNFVNSKRKESGLPVEMFLGNNVASSSSGKCELFATHFQQAFNVNTSSTDEAEYACQDTPNDVFELGVFHVDHQQVETAINRLKYSTAASPDGIPSCILKRCSRALIQPLALLFNISLSQGRFPSLWKLSVMFPVYKKGDKRNVENYRGITSLCACSKVFEIIMNDMLFSSCKNYISPDQHGFYPKRSVSTNLTEFTSFCIRKLDAGSQVDTVYTDLKAAFDRVDHKILLTRLAKLGISTDLVCWFDSYLNDRLLCVKIGSDSSEYFTNTSGVPQGSNLGPLLFSLFINELSTLLPPGCRLFYADDVKIYMVIKCLIDCFILQQRIDIFVEWCSKNKLAISIAKCNVITFHRKMRPIIFDYTISNHPLERVDHVRDLGVSLDAALTFRLHYSEIISKANRQLGFMFKISSEFRDPLCLRSLYCALVRSILESSSIVWCPYQPTWIARIEAVQKKFVRRALSSLPWENPRNLPPYEDRCRLLGLQTLEERRYIAQVMFIAKILLGGIDAPQILNQLNIYAPQRVLRQRNFMLLEPRRTVYGLHDPIRSMSASFNEVFMLFDFNLSAASFQHRLLNRHGNLNRR